MFTLKFYAQNNMHHTVYCAKTYDVREYPDHAAVTFHEKVDGSDSPTRVILSLADHDWATLYVENAAGKTTETIRFRTP